MGVHSLKRARIFHALKPPEFKNRTFRERMHRPGRDSGDSLSYRMTDAIIGESKRSGHTKLFRKHGTVVFSQKCFLPDRRKRKKQRNPSAGMQRRNFLSAK